MFPKGGSSRWLAWRTERTKPNKQNFASSGMYKKRGGNREEDWWGEKNKGERPTLAKSTVYKFAPFRLWPCFSTPLTPPTRKMQIA